MKNKKFWVNNSEGGVMYIPCNSLPCEIINREDGKKEVVVALKGKWERFFGTMDVTEARMNEMLTDYQETQRPVLFDYDHNCFLGCSKAAGWGSELRIDGENMICVLEPTTSGNEAINSGEYKYLSPVYETERIDPKTGKRVKTWRLHSVALTNIPFLTELPAIQNKQNNFQEENMKWWEILGFESEEKAIEAFKNSRGKINELQTALTAEAGKVSTLQAELTALKKAVNAQKVDAAIANKQILPKMKDLALNLINQDENLFNELIKNSSGVDLTNPQTIPGKNGDETEVTSYKQLLNDSALRIQFEKDNPEKYKELYTRWMREGK